jgi:hypothetical protein
MTCQKRSNSPLGGSNPFNPANSSVPLSGGGDTHIHPHKDGSGSTVTTRLPGDVTQLSQARTKNKYLK